MSGQLVIQWIAERINKDLNKMFKTTDIDRVVGGDTDSAYITLNDFVVNAIPNETDPKKVTEMLHKFSKKLLIPIMAKHFDILADYTNAYTNAMEMKREAIADKGIWTSKKHYILNVYDNEEVTYKEPQIKIVGLDMIKSSTPSSVREKMKEAVKVIINKEEKDIVKLIEDFWSTFRTLPIEEIAFPRGVNGMNEYKGKSQGELYIKGSPVHVKGSLVYNRILKDKKLDKIYPSIQDGEKIKFIYLKEPNPFGSPVIAFPQDPPKEFEIDKWVDYETQFNKAFKEQLKIILDVIGWHTEETSSLEEFFG